MKKYKEPYCKYCKDIPLFGCVACPSSVGLVRSRARKKISQLEDEDEVYRSEQVAEILKELIE